MGVGEDEEVTATVNVASGLGMALVLTFLGSLGTSMGACLVVMFENPDSWKLGLCQGVSAGLMLYLSLLDLVPEAAESIGHVQSHVWFFGGAVFFAFVVQLVPEPNFPTGRGSDEDEEANGAVHSSTSNAHRHKVMLSGLVTALGICLHNFPEGIAVFLASLRGPRLGIPLAISIALHNIPEGVAVAMPIYFATKSKWKGLRYAILSGLAEPLGVVLVAIVAPSAISEAFLQCVLAAVGGIMAFLVFHELLPLALTHAGRAATTTSLFVGLFVMFAVLEISERCVASKESSASV